MPALTPEQEALKQAALAATPGPWKSEPVMLTGSSGNTSWGESTGRIINGPPQTIEGDTLSKRWFTRKEDGDFIAQANPVAILALLAQLEESKDNYNCAVDSVAQLQEEVLTVHRQLAAEKLRADQGWQRYESANADRNSLRADMVAAQEAPNELCFGPHAPLVEYLQPKLEWGEDAAGRTTSPDCAICGGFKKAFGKVCDCRSAAAERVDQPPGSAGSGERDNWGVGAIDTPEYKAEQLAKNARSRALLDSFQPVQAVPDVLFDGNAVYQEIKRARGNKTMYVSANAVSDVLDAAVRLIRAAPGEAQ